MVSLHHRRAMLLLLAGLGLECIYASSSRLGFNLPSVLPSRLSRSANQKCRSSLAKHSNSLSCQMSYDSTSHEVADQARVLYSGKEDIQAQPVSWNMLQMDFVLVRSVMKLDNRFQHPESRVKSLLSAVVEMGRVDLAAALLRMGAAVNDRDHTGRTALMVACSSEKAGNWDKIVDMLLQSGADIQARDVNGDTALNYAQRFAQLCCSLFLAALTSLILVVSNSGQGSTLCCRDCVGQQRNCTTSTLRLISRRSCG